MESTENLIHTDVTVIGAGLTGLTAAYTLKMRGINVHIVETGDKIGGQIQTHKEKGFVFESGPNTGAVSNPEVAELMESLEKTSNGKCRLETAPDTAKRRLIWKGNRFYDLPEGLIGGITTPLFSLTDKFRILGEPWRKKGSDPNESVGHLARRRLGKSFVDYAVDPFLSGVYAGDPDKLITRYALPKLYNLEQNYGSFVGGAIRKAKEPKSERDKKATKKVFSAVGGLHQIPQAEADYIGESNITLDSKDVRIHPDKNGWTTSLTDKVGKRYRINSRKVITTCGAYALPSLLEFTNKEEIEKISNLRYAPVIEVAVGVNDALNGDYNAFGGLVPTKEKKDVLGILFPAACFTGRAPQKGALFTYFMGGINHREILDKNDLQLQDIIEETFHTMLKFPKKVQPDLIKIFRHTHAIPQYELSSGERFAEVEKLQNKYNGLIIAGNLRDGIGMAHRIKQAVDIAKAIKL